MGIRSVTRFSPIGYPGSVKCCSSCELNGHFRLAPSAGTGELAHTVAQLLCWKVMVGSGLRSGAFVAFGGRIPPRKEARP